MSQQKTVFQLRRDVAYWTGLILRLHDRHRIRLAEISLKRAEQALAAALALLEPQDVSK